jgi:hypothetical protein
MKLSIEATIGGAVALAFAVVSMAVMAQEQGERKIPTNNSVLNQMSARGFTNSSSAPLNVPSESPFLAQY